MRRRWPSLVATVLVIGALGSLIYSVVSSNTSNRSSVDQTISFDPSTVKPKPACTVFTQVNAGQFFRSTVNVNPVPANSSSSELTISACSYLKDQASGEPDSASQVATLLVRAPKTLNGAQSNNNQFGRFRPANAVSVSGYGQSAYWDAQYGQLNILYNYSWYILSAGPLNPLDRRLDQAKLLADILIAKM